MDEFREREPRKRSFAERHTGLNDQDVEHMLSCLGIDSLETFLERTIPPVIRTQSDIDLPEAISEEEALEKLREILSENETACSLIGQGYYNSHVPQVIKRNLFENPGWYTAYTPYQPEISQGRLELLFTYQTLVGELTGLPVSNASLLDEATAVAEGILMAVRASGSRRKKIVIGNKIFPQTLNVIETRCDALELEVSLEPPCQNTAALVLQRPDALGLLEDEADLIEQAKEAGALVIIAADPLSLLLYQTPRELGADIAVGSMQRFGTPLGYGGPHAAYIACKDKYKRLIPGRLVGQSVDSKGRTAYRLALQTREQHIRREKATSNICTAQVLLANMTAAYAVYHGAEGLTQIAADVHHYARCFAASAAGSFRLAGENFFDTVTLSGCPGLKDAARKAGFLVHEPENHSISVSFDETCNEKTVRDLCRAMNLEWIEAPKFTPAVKPILGQPVFRKYHSETRMMRYLRKLVDRDIGLDRAMIPLGSCTMKLNAAAEMVPVGWSEIANQHPFTPKSMSRGSLTMIGQVKAWLRRITGFSAVSLQPNAGSQGEYAGLLAIRNYHISRGDKQRRVCLIPTSAHGTNPASATMAGLEVISVACDREGNIDLEDVKEKADHYSRELAALMITYPSTHGVFEETVKEVCDVIHEHGGQVYLDGANLNAMVGLVKPSEIGCDVCHMNLHKTFCIPHGGGGPGVGPIGVASHLEAFLPGYSHPLSYLENRRTLGSVSSAEYGSASVLPISWMYIRMMGSDGLRKASSLAILSANYMARKLEDDYPILYRGRNRMLAHECILDIRPLTKDYGVTVEDIAKRLIDFGFHAPTMSWPVTGTLMIEPTESEPLEEIDRFCEAMIAIALEIKKYANSDDSPLKHAPFTAEDVLSGEWKHSFSRQTAAMPADKKFMVDKFWPPVSRVDNVYGDKNLVCTYPLSSNLPSV